MTNEGRWRLTVALLIAALLGIMLANVWMGPADVQQNLTPGIVLRALAHHMPWLASHVSPVEKTPDLIVWQLRLPRALAGALIGMLLAMAGVAFQSFLMNPLADPYMVGVSAGSALGSAVVILMGGV